MVALKISREEAEQLYIDDHSDVVLPEVKEMEDKAKQLKRRYEKGLNPRKKAEHKPKPDEEKISIIEYLFEALSNDTQNDIQEVTKVNPQKEITFTIGSNNYSISLIRHRPPKAEK